MKTRNIPKTLQQTHDLGWKNLLVSGCSFTYNNDDHNCCTWPYYLRDIANFQQVYDCSLPAAGNRHVYNSLVWAIETNEFDPRDTLIVVMLSGYDRDDYILDTQKLNVNAPFRYDYTSGASLGFTGGMHETCSGNVDGIEIIGDLKSHQSRAVENYILIAGLKEYLNARGFVSFMFEYRDHALPARDLNFDPRPYLPERTRQRLDQIIDQADENFYRFCLRNDLLYTDDYHPSADGHLKWTREILIPTLSRLLTQRGYSNTL